MDRKATFKNIDVLVLCGGQGTRLRSVVADKPKVLINLGGKPFLGILLENLASQGFRRVILSVGHLKEQIIDHFAANTDKNIQIEFSTEDRPLGTGGAVKKAEPFIKSDHFLVMNGDALCLVDYQKFYETHLNKGALLSMVLKKVVDASNYGKVELDKSDKIIDFSEKGPGKKSGLMSAGIYFMHKDIFFHLPKENAFSLEYDFFPKILIQPCYGFVNKGEFIDIGTPEKYERANRLFSKLI